MLEKPKATQVKDEYYSRYKPELISHNEEFRVDQTLTQRKQRAECAPHNFYNAQGWESMLARTESIEDLNRNKEKMNRNSSSFDRRGREGLEKTKRTLQPELQGSAQQITGSAKKTDNKVYKHRVNIFNVQDQPQNEQIVKQNEKNHSNQIQSIVFNKVKMASTPKSDSQALHEPFGRSSEHLNRRTMNEHFMNKTIKESKANHRRVNLQEHHQSI